MTRERRSTDGSTRRYILADAIARLEDAGFTVVIHVYPPGAAPPPEPQQSAPEAPSRDGDLLTVDDVAKLLRLKTAGVYALVEARRIPSIKISNRVRFLRDDVMKWIAKNRRREVER